MFWTHIRGTNARDWNMFTSKKNIISHMKKINKVCYTIEEGPRLKEEWILKERCLEHGQRGEARKFCFNIKAFLIRLAKRLEGADFWDAGWRIRKFSFLFEKKVVKGADAAMV